MIIIWHNGEDYSGHAVHFVDCGAYDPDAVIALLRVTSYRGRGYEIARAERLDWRKPDATESPADIITNTLGPFDVDDDAMELFRALPLDLLRALVDNRRWEWASDEGARVDALIAERTA